MTRPNRSRVRIGAGRWKGRLLEIPDGARPTSSRAREALFAILSPRLTGARVLDLYAGSGAVGLEAVSRGAAAAVLVERMPDALSRNVERIGSPREIVVRRGTAEAAVRSLLSAGERFEIVFTDPPYDEPAPIDRNVASLLAPGGVLILQSDPRTPPPSSSWLSNLHWNSVRDYGRNRFFFYDAAAEK